jgi:hypothetical protein
MPYRIVEYIQRSEGSNQTLWAVQQLGRCWYWPWKTMWYTRRKRFYKLSMAEEFIKDMRTTQHTHYGIRHGKVIKTEV